MVNALESLITLLDLEELEVNIFRGVSPKEDRQRVFGGQVAGQALVAAGRTVEAPTPAIAAATAVADAQLQHRVMAAVDARLLAIVAADAQATVVVAATPRPAADLHMAVVHPTAADRRTVAVAAADMGGNSGTDLFPV